MKSYLRTTLMFSIAASLLTIAGCAKPEVKLPAGPRIEGHDAAIKRIGGDPVTYFRESLEEAEKLESFRTRFQRQERLGVFKELKPMEDIVAEHRHRPFSVRFSWQGEDSEYLQCVYVEGKNNNKVALMPRKGVMGPPKVQNYPASFAVLFQKARNPITDFGPRRMMERVLDRIEKAQKKGGVAIKLLQATEVGPSKEPCYQFELRFPPGDPFACKLQDLYIHMKTNLPVATYLWVPGKVERCDATLDASYAYYDLNADVSLTDATFVIDAARKSEVGAAGEAVAGESSDTALAAPSGE